MRQGPGPGNLDQRLGCAKGPASAFFYKPFHFNHIDKQSRNAPVRACGIRVPLERCDGYLRAKGK